VAAYGLPRQTANRKCGTCRKVRPLVRALAGGSVVGGEPVHGLLDAGLHGRELEVGAQPAQLVVAGRLLELAVRLRRVEFHLRRARFFLTNQINGAQKGENKSNGRRAQIQYDYMYLRCV
jgi:hypothetical protein